MVEAFNGTWTLVDSQNLDEYMKALDIVGNGSKPTIVISQVVIKTVPDVRHKKFSFTLGEEFDEITLDGREVKYTITMEGESLVHVQRWDGKETKIVEEIKDDKKITKIKSAAFERYIPHRGQGLSSPSSDPVAGPSWREGQKVSVAARVPPPSSVGSKQ
ncbi:Fatty acid-binding protein, brain [Anabarilius grahami]|uniref:Fatty acid-binding protein, brain n=1 Tax=Anabarilius grahami TaxID=495550 RepID=A0A3N0Y827_ANAGA|nr:Fatty acid-binding protein, brain [Anabarilius grahami]